MNRFWEEVSRDEEVVVIGGEFEGFHFMGLEEEAQRLDGEGALMRDVVPEVELVFFDVGNGDEGDAAGFEDTSDFRGDVFGVGEVLKSGSHSDEIEGIAGDGEVAFFHVRQGEVDSLLREFGAEMRIEIQGDLLLDSRNIIAEEPSVPGTAVHYFELVTPLEIVVHEILERPDFVTLLPQGFGLVREPIYHELLQKSDVFLHAAFIVFRVIHSDAPDRV